MQHKLMHIETCDVSTLMSVTYPTTSPLYLSPDNKEICVGMYVCLSCKDVSLSCKDVSLSFRCVSLSGKDVSLKI